MIRFLFDENLPVDAIRATRLGADVAAVGEISPGLADRDVLAWAVREARVLVTLDKDFGELAFRAALPAVCGVVLIRNRTLQGAEIARLLALRKDWPGRFSVIEKDRIRMRDLLPTKPQV